MPRAQPKDGTMAEKMTYKELAQKVKALEKELADLKREKETILERKARYKEVEHLASLGHWELDLVTNSLYWSDEIYRILTWIPKDSKPPTSLF